VQRIVGGDCCQLNGADLKVAGVKLVQAEPHVEIHNIQQVQRQWRIRDEAIRFRHVFFSFCSVVTLRTQTGQVEVC